MQGTKNKAKELRKERDAQKKTVTDANHKKLVVEKKVAKVQMAKMRICALGSSPS